MPRDEKESTYIALFEKERFVVCENGEPESGYQKIALFVKDGFVEHAARLLESGDWASKLGFEHLDIIHTSVDVVAGSRYGIPKIYMKRERTESDPEAPSIAKFPPNPLSSR